jgi:methylenetetrahydrofolate reductase (NADPH)
MSDNPTISFEFFPAKTELGLENMLEVRDALAQFKPEFFSMTYGAGGSTRTNTRDQVFQFLQDGYDVAPHISFGTDDEATIGSLIGEYLERGVKRIVALRGDRPKDYQGDRPLVYANELVAFIRKEFGDDIHLEVAAYPEIHPEAKTYNDDIKYLKGKFDAGANSAITQYFFNPDAYCYFIEECQQAGITQPIFPGIMPITNYEGLVRFSDACGAEIPRWLRHKLATYADDNISLRAFGLDVVSELCEILLDNGAPGFHFYTMNQLEPVKSLVENLGLNPNR